MDGSLSPVKKIKDLGLLSKRLGIPRKYDERLTTRAAGESIA